MSFKVAIIGAGSVGFTKTLISDLLKVPEFADVEFALTDINPHNLDMIEQIISSIVTVNNLPAKVTATTDRREALTGARRANVLPGTIRDVLRTSRLDFEWQ